MSEALQLLLAGLSGFIIGIGLTLVFVSVKGEAIIHRINYKVWTLPCPNCRDENDEPTGEVEPQTDMLRRQAMSVTEDGELPTFRCQVCEGTKVISYEFPRHKPPTINERKIIVSPLPGQMSTRKRRRTV